MFKKRALPVALALMIAGALACGKPTETSTTVGPAGPTMTDSNGNQYCFSVKVYPNVINSGEAVNILAYVYNCTTLVATNGTVLATAPVVYFSGNITGDTGVAINSNGIAGYNLTSSGSAGTTQYVTVTLLDQSLTAPYQIRP